jgi:hypothetical protein
VLSGDIFSQLSPHARVATAVAPFALALLARIILGNCRATRWMISLGTVWFAVNVLMAPYSAGMRQDIENWRFLLP